MELPATAAVLQCVLDGTGTRGTAAAVAAAVAATDGCDGSGGHGRSPHKERGVRRWYSVGVKVQTAATAVADAAVTR